MIKKNCVVCGKEIEVTNPRYCCCSDECRKARAKTYKIDPESVERHKKKNREKYRQNPKIVPCKICGEPVPPSFRENKMCRSHYHEKCVLSEALQAVIEGCAYNEKRIMRAWNLYGYTKSELIEEMKQNGSD